MLFAVTTSHESLHLEEFLARSGHSLFQQEMNKKNRWPLRNTQLA